MHTEVYCTLKQLISNEALKGMSLYIRVKLRKVTKIRNLARDHDVGM